MLQFICAHKSAIIVLMTISHFLSLWYILAQVHKVDIRYFDHIFNPAPNNKYDYSSGGVRAEAGTLHIGHDFEDITRADIFLEGKSFRKVSIVSCLDAKKC